MTRASGGDLARTPGLHPTLYEKFHGIFNDHRESGPRFKVSSERRPSCCMASILTGHVYLKQTLSMFGMLWIGAYDRVF